MSRTEGNAVSYTGNKEEQPTAVSFVVYHKGVALRFQWSAGCDIVTRNLPIIRLCALELSIAQNQLVLLLNSNNDLYKGEVNEANNCLKLKLWCSGIIDVAYCAAKQQLFVVNCEGVVFMQHLKDELGNFNTAEWQTLSFDPLELSEEGIKVQKVCCSAEAAVFITKSGDFYAMGNCGEVFTIADLQPQHLRLFGTAEEFGGKEILDVVAGDEFFVVLFQNLYDEKLDPLKLYRNEPTHHRLNGIQLKSQLPQLESNRPECSNESNQELNSNSSLLSLNTNDSSKSSAASFELNLRMILLQGYTLLHTQVYSFGACNNGLLGIGDHIKRSTPSNLRKLDAQGVCSIAAGKVHSLARTLDGRLLHWGSNAQQQLDAGKDIHDLSSPSELKMDKTNLKAHQRHIVASCCGDYCSVLLNAFGELQGYGNCNSISAFKHEKDLLKLNIKVAACKQNIPLLLAAKDYTLHNQRIFQHQFHNCYNSMQQQLRLMLQHRNTIELLLFRLQKNSLAPLKMLLPLCVGYKKMLCLCTSLLYSLERFYRGDLQNPSDLYFIKYHRECIELFEIYTREYCDIYSIDGFTEAARIFSHFSSAPLTTTTTPDKDSKESSPVSSCLDLNRVFHQTFHIFGYYVQFLELLIKSRTEFKEHLQAWLSFTQYQRIELELAENTKEFWNRNERLHKIRHFRRKHRRVILTSHAVPIKISSSLGLSTSNFFLFSDCLCHFGSQIHTYPLVTMWLGKSDTDTNLHIITPEQNLVLSTRSALDKKLWYDQLEKSILSALGKPLDAKLSSSRTTAYVFSRSHAKYSGVHAYGRWRKGVLNGNCYLEYPDGKVFFGEMRDGEIEGYGKMVIPTMGLYEGNFKAGKFHGHGVYEIRDNEIYDGNFCNGNFHGHGLMRSNTYTYVGEFKDNLRNGYGVLDDVITGDKYMGMFVDNKRVGAGTCITMNGDYFEGMFSNDMLMGTGIAVFENEYYYEGELNMLGPSGRGTYYMPTIAAAELNRNSTDFEDDSTKQQLIGNVISGNLGGNWHDIKVLQGNVALNRQFPKYPSSIGALVVDNSRKWRSLFDNFEQQLMGCGKCSRKNSTFNITNERGSQFTKELWNRIAIFMCSQRQREKSLEQQQNNSLNQSAHSYFGRNISMNFSQSFDKLSLKSTNSLFTAAKSSILDISSNFNVSFDQRQRSHSHEQLYDAELNDLEFVNACTTSFPAAYHCEAQSATPLMSRKTLNSWTHDSSLNSARSSYDSALNLSESFNNNSVSTQNSLEFVPNFGINSPITEQDVSSIKEYLTQAFQDRHHPLYFLNQQIANSFYISYGCWKVKPTPLLTKQAMREWESISKRVYAFVRKMFPALPEDYVVLESACEVVSHITLLYPIVLSEGIYSTLFVLYANKYSQKDELYRQNLQCVERLSDEELVNRLCPESSVVPVMADENFQSAIETLKQLQEKYSPKEMLNVIEKCMRQITEAHKKVKSESAVILSGDSMMPLTLMMVMRSAVPHLGAELGLLDDLTAGANFQFEMNSFAGYCFTTLKAAYEHITARSLNKT